MCGRVSKIAALVALGLGRFHSVWIMREIIECSVRLQGGLK